MAKKKVITIGKEIGVTGNAGFMGSSDTGEYLTQLKGQPAMLIFDEMRRSDPQVKACLKSITLPILKNSYQVIPGADTPKDIEIAETIQDNLLERMSSTWSDTLRHIMLHKVFGFMPMEKVYEYNENEGLIKLRKLAPRMPQSVFKWNFIKGSLETIEQMDNEGHTFKIPIEKLCIFSNEKEGSNWEGISDLRPVYGNWYIKKDLMKIDAIKHERYGVGVPVGTAPEGVEPEDTAWQDMEDALRAIYSNEQGYIVKPAKWEVDILNGEAEAKGTNIINSIRYHDEAIALGFLANFLKLGTTETGSRALGESFINFFLMSLQDTSDYICQVINRFCIRELVDYNWQVDEYPYLQAGTIEDIDPEVIGNLISTGVLTKDLQVENALRARLNLSEITQEEYDAEQERKNNIAKQIAGNKKDDEGDDDNGVQGKQKKEEKGKSKTKKVDKEDLDKEDDELHEHTFGDHQLTAEEMIPNLHLIETNLDTKEINLTEQLLLIREKQIKVLAEKLSKGTKIQNITVPYKKEMFTAAHQTAKDSYKQGREEMQEEIFKQRPDLKVGQLAEFAKSLNTYMKHQDEKIEIEIEGMTSKLLSMMAKKANNLRRLERRELSDDSMRFDLENYALAEISLDDITKSASGSVNAPWGEGRRFESTRYKDDLYYYYRTGILDGNICSVCSPRHGKTFSAETEEKAAIVPDPDCKGGNKCRCLLIAVMNTEGFDNEVAEEQIREREAPEDIVYEDVSNNKDFNDKIKSYELQQSKYYKRYKNTFNTTDKVKIVKENGETSYYDPENNSIHINLEKRGRATVMHEYGHHVFATKVVNNDEAYSRFLERFKKEEQRFTAPIIGSLNARAAQIRLESMGLSNDDYMQDILAAVTHNRVGWGHSKKYYRERGDFGRVHEIFANMYHKYSSPNTAGANYMRYVFPKLHEAFMEVMEL